MPIDLMTARGQALLESGETPWQAYPRPQMKRNSYVNLNGRWDFTVSPAPDLPETFDQEILVPFCPESQLSGLKFHPEDGNYLFYRRRFTLPEGFRKDRVLLHFGAVDQEAEVYVNQKLVGSHVSGYDAFVLDITDALEDENELVVRARDDLRSPRLPYGKQTLKRGGMWYTPVSGIWQTVWMESVPQSYIEGLSVENRGASVTISLTPPLSGRVLVTGLGEFSLENGSVTISPEDPHMWSPEDPYLYEFSVETEQDRIESYFALRTLDIQKVDGFSRLCLNGKPYFFHGLLDQGYWPDGLFTPAKPECFVDDILMMKKLGFNTLRKHIKVEPEEFYYQCDKLGMIVWQDMVNNSDYNFFRDTVLPTVGIQKLDDRNLHKDEFSRKRFLEGMEATVNQLKNHPSICYWTIFNEAWGQFDSDNVFEQFKKLDDTRFVDSTSGWFRQKKSDVDSRHVYFRKVKLKAGDKPLVLSEFGGKTYKAEGHVFNPDKSYGYGGCETLEALNEALVKLYTEEILPCVKAGLTAAIYTQVSDVEDEINGLLTYDRKVEKVDPEKLLPVAAALQAAVQEK